MLKFLKVLPNISCFHECYNMSEGSWSPTSPHPQASGETISSHPVLGAEVSSSWLFVTCNPRIVINLVGGGHSVFEKLLYLEDLQIWQLKDIYWEQTAPSWIYAKKWKQTQHDIIASAGDCVGLNDIDPGAGTNSSPGDRIPSCSDHMDDYFSWQSPEAKNGVIIDLVDLSNTVLDLKKSLRIN